MREEQISEVMERYVQNEEIAGASLLVRQHGQTVYRNCWGYADKAAKTPIQENSIFRMMSMTKCVTAVGILQLMEAGKLNLDDPLSLFIPSFAKPRVADDARYRWHDGVKMGELLQKALFFRMERVKTVPAEREITIRDLLSHSSGLEQGMIGLLAMLKDRQERVDPVAQAERYAQYPLDFQPGCGTGYSPLAGFDVLARVIEVLSGMDAAQYYKANIFQPLGMQDTAFHLNEEQKKRKLKEVHQALEASAEERKACGCDGQQRGPAEEISFRRALYLRGWRIVCNADGLWCVCPNAAKRRQLSRNSDTQVGNGSAFAHRSARETSGTRAGLRLGTGRKDTAGSRSQRQRCHKRNVWVERCVRYTLFCQSGRRFELRSDAEPLGSGRRGIVHQ